MESPSHPSKFSLCIQSKAQTSQNPQSRSNVISVVLLSLQEILQSLSLC